MASAWFLKMTYSFWEQDSPRSSDELSKRQAMTLQIPSSWDYFYRAELSCMYPSSIEVQTWWEMLCLLEMQNAALFWSWFFLCQLWVEKACSVALLSLCCFLFCGVWFFVCLWVLFCFFFFCIWTVWSVFFTAEAKKLCVLVPWWIYL